MQPKRRMKEAKKSLQSMEAKKTGIRGKNRKRTGATGTQTTGE